MQSTDTDLKHLKLWRPDTQVFAASGFVTITIRIRFERRARVRFCWQRRVTHDSNNRAFSLYRDHFNLLDLFAGERQLFGLEVFYHMFLARSSGQRQHADLHGEPENDLRGVAPNRLAIC